MAILIASDDFARVVASGWGTAPLGGNWTNIGSTLSVSEGVGKLATIASQQQEAYLYDVTTANAHVRVALKTDQAYNASPQSFNVVPRKITGVGHYQARVRIEDGRIRLYTLRNETSLGATHQIMHTYAPGEIIWADVQVSGTNPTTFEAKMWLDGTPEPAAYQLSATDSTADLQAAGYPGVRFTLSSAAVGTTVAMVDNFTVEDPTAAKLATPVVTMTTTPPSSVGASDGTATLTWPAVSGADHYEAALATGTVTTDFVADDTNATSPKTYTGLSDGPYSGAVRAKAF